MDPLLFLLVGFSGHFRGRETGHPPVSTGLNAVGLTVKVAAQMCLIYLFRVPGYNLINMHIYTHVTSIAREAIWSSKFKGKMRFYHVVGLYCSALTRLCASYHNKKKYGNIHKISKVR